MLEKTVHDGIRALEYTVGSSRFLIAPYNGFRLMRWTLATATGDREILHWPGQAKGIPFANIRTCPVQPGSR